MTYLHVAISGAYPELPEIIESVSKTIDAVQSLTDAKLLQNLVWPFCISGCLALDRKHTIFQGLLSAAGITQSTVGTCLEDNKCTFSSVRHRWLLVIIFHHPRAASFPTTMRLNYWLLKL
jgi:hypothetical protein